MVSPYSIEFELEPYDIYGSCLICPFQQHCIALNDNVGTSVEQEGSCPSPDIVDEWALTEGYMTNDYDLDEKILELPEDYEREYYTEQA